MVLLWALVTVLLGLSEGRRLNDPSIKHYTLSQAAGKESAATLYNYTTYWFEVPVDHFSYTNTDTFKMKYLVNNDYYKAGGPIFFYTGNEGKVESFEDNTGMMWDLAPKFNAAVIFAEHRYYGDSLPYGNESYKNVQKAGYLTSEQALADYAQLLNYIKDPVNNKSGVPNYPSNTKIISFGGSYGGMLSAWFRMKYPHIITGSWASSAPLLYFQGAGTGYGAFDNITTRTFEASGCLKENVVKGWEAIKNLSANKTGQDYLNSLFNVDKKSLIKDVNGGWNLIYYIREAIEYMAMTDYPYPTNFLTTMPGFPVKVACMQMGESQNYTDQQLASMLYSVSTVYYNTTKNATLTACIDPAVCGDPGTASLGSPLGWPWQECTEIVIPMCAQGKDNDFFWNECNPDPIDVQYNYCKATFTNQTDGTNFGWTMPMLRVNGVRDMYGFDMTHYSNLILTQGHLDPWSGGGFKASSPGVNGPNGVYVMEIPGSAHHLDLRTPNTCDPNTVSNARYQIVNILNCWLTDGCPNPTLSHLPTMQNGANVTCTDVRQGYPWGQDSGVTTTTHPNGNASTTTAPKQSTSSISVFFSLAVLLLSLIR